MQPFATVEDYEVLYGEVDDSDVLLAYLTDATDVMMAELDASGIDYANPTEDYAYRLMRVCRTMTHRAIGDAADDGAMDGPPVIPFGATQFSQTAGPYTRSATMGNPYGDLFMTAEEKYALGIGVPKAAVMSPYVH